MVSFARSALWIAALGAAYSLGRRRRTPAAAPLADSPNAAERLQASHAFGVGAGVAGNSPTSQVGDPDEVRPGLPDFFRGA